MHWCKPAMQAQIRQVMRYAGPRMLFAHPVLTLRHYLDEITRKVTSRANAKLQNE